MRVVAAGLLLLWGARSQAQVDAIERFFGATNLHATTGNGGLTAGVSRQGDLTVLAWPSPSYYDQLHYFSANGPGARELPRMGAQEGMGAFVGLVVSTDGGATRAVTFLRDATWTGAARFAGDDTSVIEARFERSDLGLTVVQTDFVELDRDVLVRQVRVERQAASPVTGAWLLFYANLSPSLSRVPQVPLADFLSDHRSDFLAAWSTARHALLHFHPGDTGVADNLYDQFIASLRRDFGPLGTLMQAPSLDQAALDALLSDLDDYYAPGVYAAAASLPEPDQVQVGGDTTDTCAAIDAWVDALVAAGTGNPLLPDPAIGDLARCGAWDPLESVRQQEGWQWAPPDAWLDAQDGMLSGSRLAGAQVNTALRVPLLFQAGVAEATLFVAFAGTARDALASLDASRSRDVTQAREAVLAADRAFVARLAMPPGGSAALKRFCTRALLNVRVATDRQSGAIVASISRQPPYHLDWPRDGAFFNAALDIAGMSELVTKRHDFYVGTVRRQNEPPVVLLNTPVPGWPGCFTCTDLPADSWEMNYFADGLVGGPIRLEIDNTALLVWSFVNHVGYISEAERGPYLVRVWPTVKAAADFLASWRDPETGLVWPANEDDVPEFTQGLQGAGTVFGALRAAAMLARKLGNEEAATRWIERAAELRHAVLDHLYDEDVGFLARPTASSAVNPGSASSGASSWLAWPTHFLPYSDRRLSDQLQRNMAADLAVVRGEGAGGAYTTKAGVSAALALDGDYREMAAEMAAILAGEIADPETHFLGEVFLNIDDDRDGLADRRVNAVATPHLWAGILVYLTAMAYHSPESFDRYEDVLPAVHIPLDAAGCACRENRGAGLAVLAWVWVAWRRRAPHRAWQPKLTARV